MERERERDGEKKTGRERERERARERLPFSIYAFPFFINASILPAPLCSLITSLLTPLCSLLLLNFRPSSTCTAIYTHLGFASPAYPWSRIRQVFANGVQVLSTIFCVYISIPIDSARHGCVRCRTPGVCIARGFVQGAGAVGVLFSGFRGTFTESVRVCVAWIVPARTCARTQTDSEFCSTHVHPSANRRIRVRDSIRTSIRAYAGRFARTRAGCATLSESSPPRPSSQPRRFGPLSRGRARTRRAVPANGVGPVQA